jgi:acyl carrier protein
MERLAVAVLLTLTCFAAAACPGGRTPPAAHRPMVAVSPAARATPQAIPADRRQLENVIRDIVAEVLGVAPGEVDVGAPLTKQKVPADELDAVEIVMGIEDKFGVEIPDADISTPEGELREDLSVKTLAEIVAGKAPKK